MPDYSRADFSGKALAGQYQSSILNIDTFKGVDMTNQAAGVSEKRTANGTNMIRDTIGKVRKRMGYKLAHAYGARIYGLYEFDHRLFVHSGTKLYLHDTTPVLLCSTMAAHRSQGIHIGEKMVVVDGTTMGIITESSGTYTYARADANAYIPTVYIGTHPHGGGTEFEKPNRLQNLRIDSYKQPTGDHKSVFTVSYTPVLANTTTIWVMDENGEWVEQVEGTDYEITDLTKGKYTFKTGHVPGDAPIEGEDNVRIQYGVDCSEYKATLNKCTFGIGYGMQGNADRVFLSGNPDTPNFDYWCEVNDPTYFPDINYGALGDSDSPITGYSIINNQLATHKRDDDNARNIYVRYGEQTKRTISISDETDTMDIYEVTFPISTIIQGDGALSPYCFGFQIEPLFLTKGGVCATTPYTYNSERHVQNRSYYINGELKREPNLELAIGAVYKEYFLVCLNKKIYAVDTMQRAYDSGNSRSESQYECYYWTGIDAQAMLEVNDTLYFGDSDGNLLQVYDDPNNPNSYSDWTPSGKRAISARWDVLFDGAWFNRMKRILHIGIRLTPYAITSVTMWRLVRGEWSVQFANEGTSAFDFSYIDFNNFTFSTAWDNYTINHRLNMRRIDNVRFSWRNEIINEPFSIHELIVEASENGYYKGKK